jgi:hypothetical protein
VLLLLLLLLLAAAAADDEASNDGSPSHIAKVEGECARGCRVLLTLRDLGQMLTKQN